MKVVSHRSMASAFEPSGQAAELESVGAAAIDAEGLAYLSDALVALEDAQDAREGTLAHPSTSSPHCCRAI